MTYNFEIGGLGFNKYVSDQHPYERATAPFRKEQFDTSGRAGDQSLAGWWTRGQFSFHNGAGIKYYEVADGEGVLDRFQDSDGMDPFANVGELVSSPALETWFTAGDIGAARDVLGATGFGFGPHFIATDAPNKLWRVDQTGASEVTPDTWGGTAADEAVQDVCSDSVNVWVADGFKLARFAYDGWESWVTAGVVYNFGSYVKKIWLAKDRLWILVDDGSLYAEPIDPGTIPATPGEPVLTGLRGDAFVGFAESENVVYMADWASLYAIDVTEDGSGVPTYTTRVVATLPTRCTNLTYYLGRLLISMEREVRFASVAPDGGVTLGSSIGDLQGDWRNRGAATSGSSIFFTAARRGGTLYKPSVYQVDLSRPIPGRALEYAWQQVHRTDRAGVIVPYGYDYAIASYWGGQYLGSGRASGTLLTGYHRYGTLDPKVFHSVAVHANSDYYDAWGTKVAVATGSIDVSAVEADGTEFLLGTVMPGDEKVTFDIPGEARERLALRFDFNTDPTASVYGWAPMLLGYQLKALPLPKRQRLIRVPLMLFDKEESRSHVVTGRKGRAWERLSALEALEQSNAVVEFTDHDTGETGTALIESTEVMGKASSDFGGVLTVTLRKVD